MGNKNLTKTTVQPDEFSREKIELIKKTVAQGATDDELELFIYQAKRTGLDPLSRQLHFVKRSKRVFKFGQWVDEGVATIQTGIDGYRTIAARTSEYAGNDDAVFDSEDGDHPGKATVTVYRMIAGQRVAFTASARWSEYVQTYTKNGVQETGTMWKKMPYLMLAKCAEALALRKAFPQELSGIYTNEEMSQADNDVELPTVHSTKPVEKAPVENVEDAEEKPFKNLQSFGNGKCPYCFTTNKFHKPNCPGDPANKASEQNTVTEDVESSE